jgi:Spore coat polysaccharide biosynthesis protein F, CMP-KDO synthetase homolog
MSEGKIVASIEARMSSSRLPGKVLADIEGAPSLSRLVQRLRRATQIDAIVLSTSDSPSDDILAEWAKNEKLPCFRGNEANVLARVIGTHQMMGSDIVVKVCGDTPLLDPIVIDQAITTFLNNKSIDVVTTTQKRFFPDGVDAEVFSLSLLSEVAEKINDPLVHEHVSLYFYNPDNGYAVFDLVTPDTLFAPNLRLVLDYTEDLEMIRAVFSKLLPTRGENFGTADIIKLVREEPAILSINQR